MLCPISYHISAKDRVRSGDEIIKVYAIPQATADTGRLGWHFTALRYLRCPFSIVEVPLPIQKQKHIQQCHGIVSTQHNYLFIFLK